MLNRRMLGKCFSFMALGSSFLISDSLADDKPLQTINGGGITFQVPGSWKSSKPSSSMRRAQLAIPKVTGDKDDAEAVLFVFPGGAGTVEANIERWAGQFRGDDNTPPKAKSSKLKGKNTEVTRVDLAGRYVAPVFPGSPDTENKPGYQLMGAIVVTPRASYFLKIVGPEATMKAASKDFEALIASMTLEE
jgi:hypothetical protein